MHADRTHEHHELTGSVVLLAHVGSDVHFEEIELGAVVRECAAQVRTAGFHAAGVELHGAHTLALNGINEIRCAVVVKAPQPRHVPELLGFGCPCCGRVEHLRIGELLL